MIVKLIALAGSQVLRSSAWAICPTNTGPVRRSILLLVVIYNPLKRFRFGWLSRRASATVSRMPTLERDGLSERRGIKYITFGRVSSATNQGHRRRILILNEMGNCNKWEEKEGS